MDEAARSSGSEAARLSESEAHRGQVDGSEVPCAQSPKERKGARQPPLRSRGRFPSSGARSTSAWTEIMDNFRFRSCS
jgi:hypothetical protein